MPINCTPLGAGQDVGKSCVLVTLGGRTIMFDCGMHMGYQDERRYPDFSMISKTGTYTQAIDCVIITHFHLDHIGALPYLTEVCGYDGPVYMTYPTKALAPLMLEDYRKVMVERKGEQEQFSVLQIHQCIKKVIAVNLRQTVAIQEDFELRAYYAGHVLGAAMFFVRAGDDTVVYTGDYNMTPDRHLGAAQIDSLRPDLIITESTYATTIRDSKRARERDFLKAVHTCVAAGGKVLIPVFALGRAQELCILLDEYWERTNLKAPIFFSAGLTMQANVYYKLLISWTNQKVKDTYSSRNTFDFKHVAPFDRSRIDAPGPCVLFATPGMLSGGLSLEVFKHWAPSEQNMIILPGYCMAGTVGHKLMSGKPTKIELDKRTQIDVRCQVHHLSFSAHTDAKGIVDLVKHVAPRNVVLVHGEKPKIAALKSRIISELSIPCFDPANHETVKISSPDTVKISMSKRFLGEAAVSGDSSRQNIPGSLLEGLKSDECSAELWTTVPPVRTKVPVEGALVTDSNSEKRILHESEVSATLGVEQHKLGYSCLCPIYARNLTAVLADQLPDGGPMEASELSAKLPRLEASTEGMPTAKPFLNKEVTEEPETKRFRGSLQRVLSLDLERVPEVEEGDESCLNLDLEGPPFRSVQGSSTLGGFSSSSWNPNAGLSNPRIDLDINVVPDTTNMDSSPDLAVNSSLAPAGRETPEATSILQGVYTALVKWLGHKIVEGRDCIRGGRTLSVRVAPLSQFDSSHDLASAVESRRLIALLECEWEEEDNTIAHRVLGLLKGIELKFV